MNVEIIDLTGWVLTLYSAYTSGDDYIYCRFSPSSWGTTIVDVIIDSIDDFIWFPFENPYSTTNPTDFVEEKGLDFYLDSGTILYLDNDPSQSYTLQDDYIVDRIFPNGFISPKLASPYDTMFNYRYFTVVYRKVGVAEEPLPQPESYYDTENKTVDGNLCTFFKPPLSAYFGITAGWYKIAEDYARKIGMGWFFIDTNFLHLWLTKSQGFFDGLGYPTLSLYHCQPNTPTGLFYEDDFTSYLMLEFRSGFGAARRYKFCLVGDTNAEKQDSWDNLQTDWLTQLVPPYYDADSASHDRFFGYLYMGVDTTLYWSDTSETDKNPTKWDTSVKAKSFSDGTESTTGVYVREGEEIDTFAPISPIVLLAGVAFTRLFKKE